MLIRYLHQKVYTKHVWNVENNVKIRLNMNQIGFTCDWMNTSVPYERESCWNVIECFAMSCHVQSYQDSKQEP